MWDLEALEAAFGWNIPLGKLHVNLLKNKKKKSF